MPKKNSSKDPKISKARKQFVGSDFLLPIGVSPCLAMNPIWEVLFELEGRNQTVKRILDQATRSFLNNFLVSDYYFRPRYPLQKGKSLADKGAIITKRDLEGVWKEFTLKQLLSREAFFLIK